ncbi:hypothetical protein SESBI_35233 [Sesbania bispinosa]|nr:hypothetical protein SESBI_35233 [Sesbania bispinosa]
MGEHLSNSGAEARTLAGFQICGGTRTRRARRGISRLQRFPVNEERANPCAAEMGRKMVKKIHKVLKKDQMTEMVRRIMVKAKQSLVNKMVKMMAVKQSHVYFPCRPGVKDLVQLCQKAGVKVLHTSNFKS